MGLNWRLGALRMAFARGKRAALSYGGAKVGAGRLALIHWIFPTKCTAKLGGDRIGVDLIYRPERFPVE